MYFQHFGLNQAPFKITPDTSLFFPGGNRGAVLEALIYAIANGEGIVKVVGEVGSGKTMLCRMLEVELPETCEIVYLANPSLSRDDIVHAIAFELKLPVEPEDNRLQVMQQLQQYLVGKHADNKRVVIFVEEAQGMPLDTLEEIRLLSNLETSQDKLLQIVLFGQPELDEMLTAHGIRQLRERITYSFDLEPFQRDQVRDYVNARLRASGHRAGELFHRGAISELTRCSSGLLRRINILADKALLAAYADNSSIVKALHVKKAAKDSEFSGKSSARPVWQIVMAAVLALGVGLGIFAWYNSNKASPDVSDSPAPERASVVEKEQPAGPEQAPAAESVVQADTQVAAMAADDKAVVASESSSQWPDGLIRFQDIKILDEADTQTRPVAEIAAELHRNMVKTAE